MKYGSKVLSDDDVQHGAPPRLLLTKRCAD